jgi:hypothetical protein
VTFHDLLHSESPVGVRLKAAASTILAKNRQGWRQPLATAAVYAPQSKYNKVFWALIMAAKDETPRQNKIRRLGRSADEA